MPCGGVLTPSSPQRDGGGIGRLTDVVISVMANDRSPIVVQGNALQRRDRGGGHRVIYGGGVFVRVPLEHFKEFGVLDSVDALRDDLARRSGR
jgi:hypothetical protein